MNDIHDAAGDFGRMLDTLQVRTDNLAISAGGLSRAMTSAFTQSVQGGRQFDDVLRSLALRVSNLAVSAAFRPLAAGLTSGFNSLFGSLFGGLFGGGASMAAAAGAVKPFAAGGIIGTPTYFPLMPGGVGLAGEAGPEAILPLRRGSDGRLGVATDSGRGGMNVTVHIATPDPESFRRSETYITGQIARAVARGQRSL